MSSVNFSYLEGFLRGDKRVILEVLELFRQQGVSWEGGLEPSNPDWRSVVHAIKGAAGGVGANALSDACHKAEFGQPENLPAVREELKIALAEIADYVARNQA